LTKSSEGSNKKFILIANTSKYLFHYRFLLIEKLNMEFNKIIILAPLDKYTRELKNIVHFKEWVLNSSKDYDLLELISSFKQLFFSIKSIKPYLVHCHTLKPNLLISIVNFFFGINTVISFAGLGKLSTSKGIENNLIKMILRIIYFFSIYEIKYLFLLEKNFRRVKFIFQNPLDMEFFLKSVNVKFNKNLFYLIPGSGVPDKYFKSIKKNSLKASKKSEFIYCARLLKSKGIELFISLANHFKESKFIIYGDLDPKSSDSLTSKEISCYKNMNKNLIFKGEVKDPLLNHNNNYSIFVIPSLYGEGLPRGILEAMSLKIPVVASQKSCVGLFDKTNLFIISDNKLSSYIKQIDSILKKRNNEGFNDFLISNRNLIIDNYKESIIVKNTIDLYRSFS